MLNSNKEVAPFLCTTDYSTPEMNRARVLVLNDTIRTMGEVMKAAYYISDGELALGARDFLDRLLEQLEENIMLEKGEPHA